MKKKFYVTTPIYYVTAKPHLGSLYSTLIADVVARWNQLLGYGSYFVTGTDEHGQKVAQAAAQAGLGPQEFVDSLIPAYQKVWNFYHIEYDQFMRTSSAKHKIGAQTLVSTLLESGDIYVDVYEGWYCTSCETFVTRGDTPANNAPSCPSCNGTTTFLKEQTYFFKLSAYQQKLLAFYAKNPDFITPKERFNEVIRFVEDGLKDLSISRTTVPWGVPFPGDEKHTIYVWVEALCNYITAVGYGDPKAKNCFADMWPADLHIIGKDIIRFHAVYWPALLMAAELALPKRLLVHGWITVDQKKMSKSAGNAIDPYYLATKYGAEEVRYYLLRHMPITQDGDFSTTNLEQSITSELANTLSNLFNRMTVLANTHNLTTIQIPTAWSVPAKEVHAACDTMISSYNEHMKNYYIHLALGTVWDFLHIVNAYFHAQEPWKLIKSDQTLCMEVLSVVSHSLYAVATLLLPIMPYKMMELIQGLGHTYTYGIDTLEIMQINRWHKTFSLTLIKPLFVKIDQERQMVAESESKQEKPLIHQTNSIESDIDIEDIKKIALHVGYIQDVQPIAKSDKLLQLLVDFGPLGTRTILAGIKQFYTSEQLINTQAIFVYNLKPRTMMGIQSHGMMLMAKDEHNVPHIVRPIHKVPNGTRLA
ncbi:MAG TPA: methionine--tRNA ligase [Candidatus Babeliales bacterium]|nr:methionine--tRNA ligase [Candidatus Babeliales bacterium]